MYKFYKTDYNSPWISRRAPFIPVHSTLQRKLVPQTRKKSLLMVFFFFKLQISTFYYFKKKKKRREKNWSSNIVPPCFKLFWYNFEALISVCKNWKYSFREDGNKLPFDEDYSEIVKKLINEEFFPRVFRIKCFPSRKLAESHQKYLYLWDLFYYNGINVPLVNKEFRIFFEATNNWYFHDFSNFFKNN